MKQKKQILIRTVCMFGCIGMLGIDHSLWNGSAAKAANETATETQVLEDFEIVDGKLLEYKGTASVEEIEDYAICLNGVNKLTVGTGLKKIGEKGIGVKHLVII